MPNRLPRLCLCLFTLLLALGLVVGPAANSVAVPQAPGGPVPPSGPQSQGLKPRGVDTKPAADAVKKYALLVGCTDYDILPESLHLWGPANDVPLMADLLEAHFGFP